MQLFFALLPFVFVLSLFVGWVNNVIWTFHQTGTVELLLGILGAVVAPIGAFHGLYLFF